MLQPLLDTLVLQYLTISGKNLVHSPTGNEIVWRVLLGFTMEKHLCWYGYGSIPINTIFRGMNIHLPAILMFTRGTRFWHTAISLSGNKTFLIIFPYSLNNIVCSAESSTTIPRNSPKQTVICIEFHEHQRTLHTDPAYINVHTSICIWHIL